MGRVTKSYKEQSIGLNLIDNGTIYTIKYQNEKLALYRDKKFFKEITLNDDGSGGVANAEELPFYLSVFNGSSTTNPSVGTFLLDNTSNQSSATTLELHVTEHGNSANNTPWLSTLSSDSIIKIYNIEDRSQYIVATLNADSTIASSIATMSITINDIADIDDGAVCGFMFLSVGGGDITSVEKDPFTEEIDISELLQHSPSYTQSAALSITKGTGGKIGGTYQVLITTDGNDIDFSSDFIVFANDYSENVAGTYLFLFSCLPDGSYGVIIASTVFEAVTLTAPVIDTFTIESATSLTVGWTDSNTSAVESFTFEYDTVNTFDSANYVSVTDIDASTTELLIEDLTEETTYYFRIKALGDNFNTYTSDWSTIVSQISGSYLSAYYPFNGDITDESGYGNDLTNSGATLTTDMESTVDSAYYFDNTSYMTVDNNNQLTFGLNNLAISLWATFVDVTSTHYLLWKAASTTTPGFCLYVTSGTLSFILILDNGDGTYTSRNVNATVAIDTWYNIIININRSGNLEIFLDNSSKASSPISSGDLPTYYFDQTEPLVIGRRASDSSRYMYGTLDNIRIYNGQILDDTARANIYNNYL